MFSDKLFDHKYDIDDLINAFCASDKGGRFILNSRDGSILHEKDSEIETSIYTDGDDKGHIREIIPLPKIFVDEIRNNPELKRQSADVQASIQNSLNGVEYPHQLPATFEQTYGGWIRERVKDACLEWLEMHNMIPPSMRHVVDISTPEKVVPKNVKISIN